MSGIFGGIANQTKSQIYAELKTYTDYKVPKWIGLTLVEARKIRTYYRYMASKYPNITISHWGSVTSAKLETILLRLGNAKIEKEDKNIENIKKLIKESVNKVVVKKPTPEQLKKILEMLFGKGKFILSSDGSYYTLNNKTITKLLKNIDELYYTEDEHYGSDNEFIQSIKDTEKFTIKRLESNNYPSMFEGSRFNYISKLPVDLSRYQIANSDIQTYSYDFSIN